MTAKRTFLDDAPKVDPANDDRLGFAPFADRLAAALFELRAPNGYVVGLEGPWGSGKSTVLNFTKAVSPLSALPRRPPPSRASTHGALLTS